MTMTPLKQATAIAGLEQLLLSVTTAEEVALGLYRSLGLGLFATEPRALNIGGNSLTSTISSFASKERLIRAELARRAKGKSALTF
jgi:hypothetical protein